MRQPIQVLVDEAKPADRDWHLYPPPAQRYDEDGEQRGSQAGHPIPVDGPTKQWVHRRADQNRHADDSPCDG